ncbi:hypothetical protein DY000_02030044 [Brassica cretica]|uniref:Flotillin-like n=1 Tax=Brassica cretica TaxID=69181 RepID=A0ABQ7DCZ1_BRACR|nr:hypothetical protein DY000_02030044 [Brassica cretica]
MLKQILESQTRSEKHIGYKLKNLHTKVDGSYNDPNNNFLYGTEFVSQAAAQIVDKTEHKAMERVKAQAELKVAAENLKRDEHKAENQVEREAVQRLKEKVSIDDPIGISIDTPFAISIDCQKTISIDASS